MTLPLLSFDLASLAQIAHWDPANCIAVVTIWLTINILLHEVAHATASRLLGRRVAVISFGIAPFVAIPIRDGGELRLGLPWPRGYTEYHEAERFAKWREWLCTLAGPLSHTLAAAAIGAMHGITPSLATYILFWLTVFLLADGLLPTSSDGRKLWRGIAVAVLAGLTAGGRRARK
uniref:hypothetical protein n=1 Tax=Cupriavidus gilardii TaxID=82541 RepID=UPI00247A94EC|nr:hypothetical protein [Cupriavidus gilardii]